MKGHIKANAKAFNLTEMEQLTWDGFAVVTPNRWKKLVRHVREKVEDHYWSCDGLYKQYTQQFIKEFGDSESNSDTIRLHWMGTSSAEDSLSNGDTSGDECISQDTYSACSQETYSAASGDSVNDGGTSGEESMCSCDCV